MVFLSFAVKWVQIKKDHTLNFNVSIFNVTVNCSLSTNQSTSIASYLSQDNSGKSDPVVATTVVSTFEVAKSRYYKIPIMH